MAIIFSSDNDTPTGNSLWYETFENEGRLEAEVENIKHRVSEGIRQIAQKLEGASESYEQTTLEQAHNTKKILTEEDTITEGHDGKKYFLKIRTLDISGMIPLEVKLVYVIRRLIGIAKIIGDTAILEWLLIGLNATSTPSLSEMNELINYLAETNPNSGYLTNQGGVIMERARKKIRWLLWYINDGMIDKKTFVHVIGWYSPNLHGALEKRYPHKSSNWNIEEIPLSIQDSYSDDLWVNAGISAYDGFFKATMLIDSQSEKFQSQVDHFTSSRDAVDTLRSPRNLSPITDERMREHLEKAGSGVVWLRIIFKKSTHWSLIAKQIFDPYHGRLIKVVERDVYDDVFIKNVLLEIGATIKILQSGNIIEKMPLSIVDVLREFGIPKEVALQGWPAMVEYFQEKHKNSR